MWAVNVTVSGLELVTIAWILLAVGALGGLLSLLFWSSWGGFGAPHGRPRGLLELGYIFRLIESPASAGLSR